MPFWRTLRVTEQIKHHRLLHPDRPPIVISRDQLALVHEQNAYKIFGRTIDVRRIIGKIFDIVFKYACSLPPRLFLRCFAMHALANMHSFHITIL